MQGKNFDIFISYRRSDGDEIAAKINETLKGNHYRCFFDFESLKNGRFDERIERAIEDAPVFIALLTPHYLERPKEDKETEVLEEDKENQEQDWVIREIECAIKNKRKIIPIDYNRKFTDYPKSISEEIKKGLGGHNFAVVSSGQQYPRDMKALMEEWISEVVPPPTQKTQGKANIEVLSDANCDILKAGEVIATISKGGYNILKLPAGRHRLICRSNEFSDIEQRAILEINKDLAEDFIDVKLADKVQERRNEIAEKEKAEEDAKQAIIAKAKAEQERIEREKREAEQKRLALEKAERLRVERQRQQAEERRKAEEARLVEEKQRVKKLHSKVDKIKQRISWIDKYLWIILIPISILFSLGIFLFSPPSLSFKDWLLCFSSAMFWEGYLLFSFLGLIDSFKIEVSDTKGIKLGFNYYNGIVVSLITPLLSMLFFVFILDNELWRCWMMFPMMSIFVFFMLYALGILIDQIIKNLEERKKRKNMFK